MANVVWKSKLVTKFVKKIEANVKQIEERRRAYINAISPIVFRDVIEHFEMEQGPEGRWKNWSPSYEEFMTSIGKGANLILQDTGRMRNAFKPTKWRKAKGGIMWFNNAKTKGGFPYAGHHNETRTFMWLSDKALDKIAEVSAKWPLKGL